MNFLGEKEVTVKLFGKKRSRCEVLWRKKKVKINFPGEKEVTMKFLEEKEVMVKPPGGKEAMLIDEDPFPLAASINIATNIATIDSRAMLNGKKAGKFSPSARVRNVWIPKQYLTYKMTW